MSDLSLSSTSVGYNTLVQRLEKADAISDGSRNDGKFDRAEFATAAFDAKNDAIMWHQKAQDAKIFGMMDTDDSKKFERKALEARKESLLLGNISANMNQVFGAGSADNGLITEDTLKAKFGINGSDKTVVKGSDLVSLIGTAGKVYDDFAIKGDLFDTLKGYPNVDEDDVPSDSMDMSQLMMQMMTGGADMMTMMFNMMSGPKDDTSSGTDIGALMKMMNGGMGGAQAGAVPGTASTGMDPTMMMMMMMMMNQNKST